MDNENTVRSASNGGKWTFSDYKIVKLMGPSKNRLGFQRKGKCTRGLSITKDAFLKMEDVTLTPGGRIALEPNVWLINYGKHVNLIKYCHTKDGLQCNGGLFQFTPKEWMQFWTVMRRSILHYWNE